MQFFVCILNDKWQNGRCGDCRHNCSIGHPETQRIGKMLWGEGFDQHKPATGKGLVAEGSNPE